MNSKKPHKGGKKSGNLSSRLGRKTTDRQEESGRPAKKGGRPQRSASSERSDRSKFKREDGFKKDFRSGVKRKFDDPVRLNKFIANSGLCSRRDADELIKDGAITVNGEVVTEMGVKVSRTDKVMYGDKVLSGEQLVYVLLNKPKDYITTMRDPQGRRTVRDLVKNACKERIYPVGRLDRNTTGLLLLTNDGEMADKLTHPRNEITKIYHVELDKAVKPSDLEQLRTGVELEDGEVHADNATYVQGEKRQVGLELHSGKNRVVRRMFEALGYEVLRLDRVMFAGLTKKEVPRGRWRMLTEKEVGYLRMLKVGGKG